MKRWMAMVGVVGLMLLALAVPSATRAQEEPSGPYAYANDPVFSSQNGTYTGTGVGGRFKAGDHFTISAGPPTDNGDPTTITVTFNSAVVGQTAFPGTIEYTVQSDTDGELLWTVSVANATWNISCTPANTPPPTAPTCQGKTATIYVKDGKIVGGPDNGKNYKGKLNGTKGNDVIIGTEGKDSVDAKAGNDTICGLGGDDKLTGDDGNDVIDGGSGNDTLKGSGGDDRLLGGDGDDNLDGDTGNDTLDGSAGKDFLDGDDGNDTLTGGSGPDRFKGGDGTDTATDFNASEGDTKESIP